MLHAAQRNIVVTSKAIAVRQASTGDLEAIRLIYNQGIEDRVATLDADSKTGEDIAEWWSQHADRYSVFVALESEQVIGWASINRFSHRCAHADIADLSVYVARSHRGKGVGSRLLRDLIKGAAASGFNKIVLHALDLNEHGKRLYREVGFVEVGVFRQHGRLDGRFVDVVAMELLLR